MGNIISRSSQSADAAATTVTEAQVEGIPAASQDAAKQVEEIDANLMEKADASSSTSSECEEEDSQVLETKNGVAADVAQILDQGLHQDEEPTSLPSWQAALQDLKAKHNINGEGSSGDHGGKTKEMIAQEARLRAMLQSKKRPAPKQEESSSESSSGSGEDVSESDSSDSSEDEGAAQKQPNRKRIRLENGSLQIDESDLEDDDDDEAGASKGPGGLLKTDHELEPPPVEPPPIAVFPPEAGELVLLGHVHNKAGNVAVIKSAHHGETDILDSGTLVGLQDRTVIGLIFETFGPLAAPFFSVRFSSESDPSFTSLAVRQPVFFSPSNRNYASILKTFDVKAMGKGSDASNVFDEEPATHELEFSDDEQEQAHKRAMKKSKQKPHQEQQRDSAASGSSQQHALVSAQQQRQREAEAVNELIYDDVPFHPAPDASTSSLASQEYHPAVYPPSNRQPQQPWQPPAGPKGQNQRGARGSKGGSANTRGNASGRGPRGRGRGNQRGGRGAHHQRSGSGSSPVSQAQGSVPPSSAGVSGWRPWTPAAWAQGDPWDAGSYNPTSPSMNSASGPHVNDFAVRPAAADSPNPYGPRASGSTPNPYQNVLHQSGDTPNPYAHPAGTWNTGPYAWGGGSQPHNTQWSYGHPDAGRVWDLAGRAGSGYDPTASAAQTQPQSQQNRPLPSYLTGLEPSSVSRNGSPYDRPNQSPWP